MLDPKLSLSRDGYVVVPEFLNPEMVRALQAICKDVLSGLDADHREKFKSTGSLCNFGDHPAFSRIVSHPDVADVMSALGIEKFKWLAGYLISKPGYSPPLFWHQDWWGWSEEISYQPTPLGLGFMYYLTDTKPENGCLRVIPGSHRNWHELHDLPEAHGEDLSRARDLENVAFQSHPDEVAVSVKAGDLVIMDSRVLHSAYPNQTANERSLLTLWYLPEFQAMPEPIRARFFDIFSRKNLDVDVADQTPISPLDWPEDAKDAVRSLFPTPVHNSVPNIWERRPNRQRMSGPS